MTPAVAHRRVPAGEPVRDDISDSIVLNRHKINYHNYQSLHALSYLAGKSLRNSSHLSVIASGLISRVGELLSWRVNLPRDNLRVIVSIRFSLQIYPVNASAG